MVNLGKTRVNRKLGAWGEHEAALPMRTTPAGGSRLPGGATGAIGTVDPRARIAPGRVLDVTKRPADRLACLFSALDVACQPRSGILAVVALVPRRRIGSAAQGWSRSRFA